MGNKDGWGEKELKQISEILFIPSYVSDPQLIFDRATWPLIQPRLKLTTDSKTMGLETRQQVYTHRVIVKV